MSRDTQASAVGNIEQIAAACIHCGLCLDDCPTYQVLGNEMDSPRGRILLMRALADERIPAGSAARTHLDRCLGCRACETACPSGVRYAMLLEHAREHIPAAAPAPPPRGLALLLFWILPFPWRFRLAIRLGLWLRRLGLLRLAVRLFPRLSALEKMLPPALPSRVRLALRTAPPGQTRADVLLFTGCATSVLTPRTLENTQRVLLHHGCAVNTPARQVCCGAIHLHSGRPDQARVMALANLAAFDGDAPIIAIAAGCGAMLKGYGDLLASDARHRAAAQAFARRVRDVSEYVCELGVLPPVRRLDARVACQDACHLLHAQRISAPPRELLRRIPGVMLVEPRDPGQCCGAAGSYNLQHPEIAAELGRRKLQSLRDTGASVVASGNIGCMLHLQGLQRQDGRAAAPLRLVHTIDLLHAAYGLDQNPPAKA